MKNASSTSPPPKAHFINPSTLIDLSLLAFYQEDMQQNWKSFISDKDFMSVKMNII